MLDQVPKKLLKMKRKTSITTNVSTCFSFFDLHQSANLIRWRWKTRRKKKKIGRKYRNKKDANRNGSFELRMNDFIMKRIR